MTGEQTVPLLPCASIDEIEEFYTALHFERTYRQLRPNPYIALQRDDIALHFFGMPGFDPATSYGTCLVVVPDVGALYAAFAAGLREGFGKLPSAGIPRITRPRARKNADGLTGFSLVDPGGNWIRVTARATGSVAAEIPLAGSRLAEAVANAVVLGDSQGNNEQAAKILDGALGKHAAGAEPVDVRNAWLYRAELAIRLGDQPTARAALDNARSHGAPAAELADLLESLD